LDKWLAHVHANEQKGLHDSPTVSMKIWREMQHLFFYKLLTDKVIALFHD
jgi:hypothetical protein